MSWTKLEKEKIEGIHNDVQSLTRAIMGDSDNVDSKGLVGKVEENTRFRKGITRKVHGAWVLLTGLGGKMLYGWWVKTGGS